MSNSLRDFLKHTADTFDYLEKSDRYFSDVYEIKIVARPKKIVSSATAHDLAQIDVEQAEITTIEQLCEELVRILRAEPIYSWLRVRDTHFSSFTIDLYNGVFLYERLVEVDDDGVHFECFGTLDDMRDYKYRKNNNK